MHGPGGPDITGYEKRASEGRRMSALFVIVRMGGGWYNKISCGRVFFVNDLIHVLKQHTADLLKSAFF